MTEIDPDDYSCAFGLCDLSQGFSELRYVSPEELAAVPGQLGLCVVRDLHFKPMKPISAYARAARLAGRIVT